MKGLVYLNNKLVSKDEAKISVFDYGFLYGYGVFETMRAYDGKVFCLSRHLERLTSSLRFLEIPVDKGVGELERIVQETVEANELTDAYVRLTVSSGVADPTLLVVAQPLSLYLSIYRHDLDYFYEHGMQALVVKERVNSYSQLPGIKSLNYLQNRLARKEAKKRGVDEGILLNTEGYVAEGASSNLFVIRDEQVVTPSVETGILPGITREVAIGLVKGAELSVREERFKLDELLAADECFLTNSLIEIMPLARVDQRSIGTGKPGETTLKLLQAYRRLVLQETS